MNPNQRLSTESHQQYRERLRAQSSVKRVSTVIWNSLSQGTFRKSKKAKPVWTPTAVFKWGKQAKRLPRPTERVNRTCQIQGPLSQYRNAMAVQKNELAFKSIMKYRFLLPTLSKPDLLRALRYFAKETNLIVSL